MKHLGLVICAFLFSSPYFNLLAQDYAIDSLKNELEHEAVDSTRFDIYIDLAIKLYMNGKQDESFHYLSKADHLAQSRLGQRQLMVVFQIKGKFYKRSHKHDSALYYTRKSFHLAKTLDNKEFKIRNLIELGDPLFAETSKDSLTFFLKEAVRLHTPEIDIKYKRRALNQLALHHHFAGRNSMALKYAAECEKVHPDNYYAYNTFGMIYRSMGNHSLALDYYLKALEIIKNPEMEAYSSILISIGSIYANQKKHEEALKYFQKSLENEKIKNNPLAYSNMITKTGYQYLVLGKNEKAYELYRKSLNIVKKHKLDCYLFNPTGYLASYFVSLNQLDSAEYYYNIALQSTEACGMLKYKIGQLRGLGAIAKIRQNTMEAKALFLEAFELAQSVDSKVELRRLAKGLYEICKDQKQYQEALKYHEVYKANGDSIFNNEIASKMAALESEFEFEKEKNQLKAEQEKEALAYESELEKRKILVISAIISSLIFLVLFVNYYFSYRRKKQDIQTIKSQKTKILESSKLLDSKNKELSKLSEFKEKLVSMIAHDMKNSLNTILGLSTGTTSSTNMKRIGQSGQIMLNLVTNMLDVQKFEDTKVPLNYQHVSISNLFRETRLRTELLLQIKSLRLQSICETDLIVNIDFNIIIRVMVNLVTNAIKYSGVGQSIILRAESFSDDNESKVIISVEDHGHGIAPEKLPFIFDKYWQDKAKDSGEVASTGLGLTFCKLAIDAHNAVLTAESQLGKGTKILITLPYLEEIQNSNNTTINESLISDQVQDTLSENEKLVISKYQGILSQYEVYQLGELNEVLNQLDEEEINSHWKEDLKAAVFQGDQKKFEELLKS